MRTFFFKQTAARAGSPCEPHRSGAVRLARALPAPRGLVGDFCGPAFEGGGTARKCVVAGFGGPFFWSALEPQGRTPTGQFETATLVLVEGVNLIKKHAKPSTQNPQGGIIEKEAPIHISNVSLTL